MDIRKVKKLIEMLENSNLEEIEIQEGEESVRLVKGNAKASIPTPTQSTIVQQESSITSNSEESVIEELEEDTDGNFINSPMVGTFYASASPCLLYTSPSPRDRG